MTDDIPIPLDHKTFDFFWQTANEWDANAGAGLYQSLLDGDQFLYLKNNQGNIIRSWYRASLSDLVNYYSAFDITPTPS
jgi:hypothetical protein